ncbi:sulfate transporter [Striga asiatica]|uniref:Sulfate transporter n=1 Tax=Striga asiatica TaxID=4170 RepID=A0A5A7QTN2_STRAF|nr:sulfate transporter [Striga asiatica]
MAHNFSVEVEKLRSANVYNPRLPTQPIPNIATSTKCTTTKSQASRHQYLNLNWSLDELQSCGQKKVRPCWDMMECKQLKRLNYRWRNKCAAGHSVSAKETVEVMTCEINEAISCEISEPVGEAKPEDNSPIREVALTVSTMDGPSLILFEIPELVGIFRLLLFAFYADMGSSRDIAIGPVAVVSLLLRAMLQNEIEPVKNAHYYRWLAFTTALFAGITQATLSILQ